MIPKILLLVKQIRPATTQIYDLRTAVTILLQARAFEAVEGVGNSLATAHDAFVLVVAEGALVADVSQGCRAHVGIADGAFTIALVAKAANGYSSLLAAHDEIGMMAGHSGGVRCLEKAWIVSRGVGFSGPWGIIRRECANRDGMVKPSVGLECLECLESEVRRQAEVSWLGMDI